MMMQGPTSNPIDINVSLDNYLLSSNSKEDKHKKHTVTRSGCSTSKRRKRLFHSVSNHHHHHPSRYNRTTLTVLGTIILWSVLLLLFDNLVVPTVNAQQHQYHQQYYHQQHQQAPPPHHDQGGGACEIDNIKYDWERWNSYEILGLEDPPTTSSSSSSKKSSSSSSKELQKRQKQRTAFTVKDIRKAYRQQAMLYHPDKNTNRNNKNGTTTTTTTTTNVEESNARFARISEAHTVLSNPDSKQEYDTFLRYCEEAKQQQQQQQSSSSSSSSSRDWASSFFSQFTSSSKNPLEVLEDYLFGGDDDGEATDNGYYYHHHEDDDDDYSQYDSYFYGSHTSSSSSSEQQQQQQHHHHHHGRQQHGRPVRVYESQDVVYHPSMGQEVVRVSQTEEYAPEDSSQGGRFYYRIMAQDFVQVYDPYQGLVLQPVTPPYLLDEGWKSSSHRPSSSSSSSSSRGRSSYSSSSSSHHRQQQKKKQQYSPRYDQHPFKSNTINVGDILTPNSSLLTSPNGRFYAGLSPECQLLIFSDNSNTQQQHQYQNNDGSDQDRDDDLIWSSPPVPPLLLQQHRRQGSSVGGGGDDDLCFAMLRDSHLIVAMGTPEHPTHLLWYSDPDPQQGPPLSSPNSSSKDNLDPTYYIAQLDDDGSLAVYRVETIPKIQTEQYNNNREKENHEKKYPWTSFLSAAMLRYPPRTKAAKAWMATRNWVTGIILAREYSSQFILHKTCIHATGPLGCYRSARRLRQLAKEGQFHVKRVVTQLDHVLDHVISFLVHGGSGGDEYDDDENINYYNEDYHRFFSYNHHRSDNHNDDNYKEDLLERMIRKLHTLKEETKFLTRRGVRVVREKVLDRLEAAGFSL